ncbi:MAG: 50S ribosomal protein L6 [Planctomycetota bacterium]
MSRIGKKPVALPSGLSARVENGVLTVEAGSNQLSQWIDPRISVEIDKTAREIRFHRTSDGRQERALHGLYRAISANMVHGLTKGFERQLEIVGIGYNAKVDSSEVGGGKLVLQVGFCHPILLDIPNELTVECPKATSIVIRGSDKQKVGQFAADVRRVRPPEPYKGKGIRYVDEHVRRKTGKSLGT